MALKSDYGQITDFDCWQHPAWSAFTALMEGRCYGFEALNQAWAFFRAGWESKIHKTPLPVELRARKNIRKSGKKSGT